MKNKFSIILLLTGLTMISCKNEKNVNNEVKTEENKSFNVIMDLIVEKDDNFQIYYNEDGSDNFTADKFVNVDVKGKPEAQELVFKLPEDALPTSLRFDIGSNKEQKEVKIIDFKMKYFDKKFEAKDTMFVYYFGNNTSIEYIRNKAVAVPKPNEKEGYDPIFKGTEILKKEMQKLVK